VTTLLIPGHNDSEEEVARLCAWFVRNLGQDVPLHLAAFHPDFKMMDVAPTPAAILTRARRQALRAGIHHVYTGNVDDVRGQSTTCASCGRLLIERSGYTLGRWNLTADGRCKFCGARLAGHFDPEPGRWGSRWKPLFIRS
jgi:pyruvate formate lyase activating enzyme